MGTPSLGESLNTEVRDLHGVRAASLSFSLQVRRVGVQDRLDVL